tara:strand:- start:57538 stop:58566 length:1029 start_codon:yes stop_codon:yes gene_type:complete
VLINFEDAHMKLKTALIVLTLSSGVMASEVDSFTGRFEPLEDSLEKVNIKANDLLKKGIRLANEEGKGCDEKRLYKVLRKRFRNKYTDEFSEWAYQTPELDRIITPVTKSIYRDWTAAQAPVPGGWARWVKDPSASMLLVNGEYIGDDKFEHFFGSGFAYFKKNYLKKKGLAEALKHGFRAETGYMGATTTGVMAYGDLTANFNGMRFWNHMLQQREDILGKNVGPYIRCENNQWKKVEENPIDFSNYIDAAFDEGINCSAFNGEKLVVKIKARLKELSRDTGIDHSCPMNKKKLRAVWKKYGKYSAFLINVEGHRNRPKMKFEEYMRLTPEKVEAKTGFRP